MSGNNNNNLTTTAAAGDADLDRFLAGVEGKLRGPFTPLELTKVMVTPALRSGISMVEYTQQLAAVFGRTEKVIQLRILLALAALWTKQEQVQSAAQEDVSSSSSSNDALRETMRGIFADAQTAGGQEEWVRIVSGIVERLVFDETATDTAQDMLQTACQEIIASVQNIEEETKPHEDGNDDDDDDDDSDIEIKDDDDFDRQAVRASRLRTADVDPTLAPFRYALLKPSMLSLTDMEVPHFRIDTASDLLQIDARLEAQKAQEEADHNTASKTAATSVAGGTGKAGAKNQKVVSPGPIMPGLARRNNATTSGATKKASSAASTRQSSMFLTNRKPPGALAGRGGGGLHVRKAGASQRLVGKGRAIKTSAATTTTGKTSLLAGAGGRAAKLRDAKASKMKMLDMSEVQGLTTAAAAAAKEKEQTKALPLKKGLKRKAMAAAAAASAEPTPKVAKTTTTTTANANTAPTSPSPPTTTAVPIDASLAAGALAAGALAAYQKKVATAAPAAAKPAPAAPTHQLDWRELLSTKSNKLNESDRYRIEQFFDLKHNPTPEQRSYRVKLHEERGNDPQTGEPIKWTYYLNLNYDDWTSTQSKKRKRYTD